MAGDVLAMRARVLRGAGEGTGFEVALSRVPEVGKGSPRVPAGWYVLVSDTPWDLIVSKGDAVRFVECKSPGGTLTTAQTRLLCECPSLRPVFARSSREALLQLEPKAAPVECTSASDVEGGA